MFAINDPRMTLVQHLSLMVSTKTEKMQFSSASASIEEVSEFEKALKQLPDCYEVNVVMSLGVIPCATWTVAMKQVSVQTS